VILFCHYRINYKKFYVQEDQITFSYYFCIQVHPETLSSGPQPLLSQEQESRLVNHIKKMTHLGYGYTRTEVTTLATDYAVDLGLKGKDGKPLSLQWFRSFMDRWPELKTQRPRALAMSRAKCTS